MVNNLETDAICLDEIYFIYFRKHTFPWLVKKLGLPQVDKVIFIVGASMYPPI